MPDETSLLKRGTKRARTRHGCTNCKTKRRKCDEIKPTCGRCTSRSEKCEWASRLTFRAENALGVEPSSLHRPPPGRQPARFRIKDVTAEVIRDYQHYDTGDDVDGSSDQSDGQHQQQQQASTAPRNDEGTAFQEHFDWQHNAAFVGAEPDLNSLPPSAGYVPLPTPGDLESIWHSPVATTYLDDSVFLPGSAYLDAHSTFRNHLIQEVRSNVPTRQGTPDASSRIDHVWGTDANYAPNTSSHIPEISPRITTVEDQTPTAPTPPPLSPEEEFTLWKNWFDEVAPWIDKFDPERHFRHTLPVLARSHSHLHYSILALSARQLEQKTASKHTARSLSLYQTAIQLVLPHLHTRSTPVIASCVVLCVLEMLSSSAKAWHQHLDGCAHLLEAVGINGFSGGVDQALFWCFARMDVCGGLIASSRTLIPVERWAGGMDVDSDVRRFRGDGGFNVHACEAVYLVAQILDLLSFHDNLAGRTGATPPITSADAEATYVARWTRLWSHVSAWYAARPAEMLPISCFSTPACPFPRILYSNPAAMSGIQLHHTACILLLRHRPSGVTVTPKPNSIFWHARQICGISMSNDDHAAWTNAIQPLWIAGQWMSHETEQKAILRLLDRIEKQSGWSTKWRAEDLKEFWG